MKTNELMQGNNRCFFCENLTTHILVLCGHNVESLNVKPSGTYKALNGSAQHNMS